jgi:hypothetical protein
MRKTAVAVTLISALLITAMAGTVYWVKANPWIGTDWVAPADDTGPPALTITSPQKNIVYYSNNITLSFNALVGESKNATYMRLMQIYYKTDWEQNETYAYNNEEITIPGKTNDITKFSYNINLTGVPVGIHNITLNAVEWGAYIDGYFVHMFSISGSSSVNFFIDAVSPSVSVLSPVSSKYDASNIPLNFSVSEPVSNISYSLDGQDNITMLGNITLTNLTNGTHNVTVYAWDPAGNIGASETVNFIIAKVTESQTEPFSTILVTISFGASVVAVAVGVLVYFKKRKFKCVTDRHRD